MRAMIEGICWYICSTNFVVIGLNETVLIKQNQINCKAKYSIQIHVYNQ